MAIEPVSKSIWVPLEPQDAFDLLTKGFENWWPGETHSLSPRQNSHPKKMTVSAQKSGKIVETLSDGSTSIWGHFSHFDTPTPLEITGHVGRSPSEATRVSVSFATEGAGTRLILIHDGWEALGEDGQGMRDGYNGGWVGVLGHFEKACETASP